MDVLVLVFVFALDFDFDTTRFGYLIYAEHGERLQLQRVKVKSLSLLVNSQLKML